MDDAPNVTIHSITDDAAAAAVKPPGLPPGTIIDSKNRRIVIRPVDALEEYRLAKIMGESGDSAWARSIALQAVSVREFEGDVEAFPNTDREIEAMIQRLGSEGFDAVAKAHVEYIAAKPKANQAALKN